MKTGRAKETGAYLRSELEAAFNNHPNVGDIRGAGLFLGVELVKDRETRAPATEETGKAVNLARSRGLLILPTGTYGNVLRFLVPLTVELAQVDEGLAVLERALADVA